MPDAPVPAVGVNGAGRFTITNSPGSIRLYRLKVSWIPYLSDAAGQGFQPVPRYSTTSFHPTDYWEAHRGEP